MKTEIYNANGEKIGTTELSDRIFGAVWNPVLVKQVFDGEMANKRRPWAHTKGRGDVSGGGKKPWRQKGTGRARHGSTRSPIWVGGGVSHGPIKERNYKVKINKKMKRAALFSVLSRKLKDGEAIFLDELKISQPKTKEMFLTIKNLREKANVYRLGGKGGNAILAVAKNENVKISSRNLPHMFYMEAKNLNVVELLNNKYVVFDKQSAKSLEENFK